MPMKMMEIKMGTTSCKRCQTDWRKNMERNWEELWNYSDKSGSVAANNSHVVETASGILQNQLNEISSKKFGKKSSWITRGIKVS
jgi:midasin (ATPase involved in ribosome maturation)